MMRPGGPMLPRPPYSLTGLSAFLEATGAPVPVPPGDPAAWTCLLAVFGPGLLLTTGDRGQERLLDADMLRALLLGAWEAAVGLLDRSSGDDLANLAAVLAIAVEDGDPGVGYAVHAGAARPAMPSAGRTVLAPGRVRSSTVP